MDNVICHLPTCQNLCEQDGKQEINLEWNILYSDCKLSTGQNSCEQDGEIGKQFGVECDCKLASCSM